MITRREALGLLGSTAAAGVLPSVTFAAPRLAYDLKPVAVSADVWMIEGLTEYFTMQNGGAIVNCVLLKGDTGMIVVDTGSSLRYGEALSGVIRTLDIRGASAVVNTHHHPDHYFGNQVFAGKPLYALGQTIVDAQTQGDAFADNMYGILGDWMRGTEPLPPGEVVEGGTIMLDGRAFTAVPLAGHTAADLVLQDQATGLVIAGDLLFLDRSPTTPHADLAVWQQSLRDLEDLSYSAIVPGHGPLDRTGASIRQTRGYLTWLEETLSNAARSGLDMVEVMELPLPDQYAALGAMPQEYRRSVAHLFPDIELTVLPRGN